MITLDETGINISGKYYTVVGGYQSSKQENFRIEYKNLLLVDHVRRRSKKIYFTFILFASLLVALPTVVIRLLQIIGLFTDTNVRSTIITLAFILSLIFLVALFFSSRASIEFTFIGGVIRVPCSNMRKNDITQLIYKIRNKKRMM
ncbi:MAG: hypothetical protein FWD90_06580 [Defluviitaleaceae bacterium]|nr:hypothetical protein [Defluviitaleaceae bacterium]